MFFIRCDNLCCLLICSVGWVFWVLIRVGVILIFISVDVSGEWVFGVCGFRFSK